MDPSSTICTQGNSGDSLLTGIVFRPFMKGLGTLLSY